MTLSNSLPSQPSQAPLKPEQLEALREMRERKMLSLMQRIGLSSGLSDGLPGPETGKQMAELMKMGMQERARIEGSVFKRLGNPAFRKDFQDDVEKARDLAVNLDQKTYLKGFGNKIETLLRSIGHESVDDPSETMKDANFLLKSPNGHALDHEVIALFRRDRLIPWQLAYNAKNEVRYKQDTMYKQTADLVAALDTALTKYEKQVLDIRRADVPTPSQVLAMIDYQSNPPPAKGEYSTKSEMGYVARLLITFTAATGMLWNVVGSILSRGKMPGFTKLSFGYAAAAAIAAYWPHITKQSGVKFQQEIHGFAEVWGDDFEHLSSTYFRNDKEGWAKVAGKIMEKESDTHLAAIKKYGAEAEKTSLTKEKRDEAKAKLQDAQKELREFLGKDTPSLDEDIKNMIKENKGKDIDAFVRITTDAKKSEQGKQNLIGYIRSGATKQDLRVLGEVAKGM